MKQYYKSFFREDDLLTCKNQHNKNNKNLLHFFLDYSNTCEKLNNMAGGCTWLNGTQFNGKLH